MVSYCCVIAYVHVALVAGKDHLCMHIHYIFLPWDSYVNKPYNILVNPAECGMQVVEPLILQC